METQRILMRSLAVVFIASVIWTITDAEQKETTCCTAVSTVEFTDPIIGVRMQKQSLPCVMAVIFETEKGEFCCDPRQPWVQKKAIQFMRAQINKRLTSTPSPASPIISTDALQEERFTSTCCKAVSTVEFTDPIIGVRKQEESLPCVNAIILKTERGEFCCDPRQPWVQKKVMQLIAQRNKRQTPSLASSIISTDALQEERFTSTCCTAVSTVEFTDPIIGFWKQKQSLQCVKAVIFETEQGQFCSDPSQRWVQKKARQFIRNYIYIYTDDALWSCLQSGGFVFYCEGHEIHTKRIQYGKEPWD